MELVVVDIVHTTQTVLTDTVGSPLHVDDLTHGIGSTLWSQDSQRIIAALMTPQGQPQALLLGRDGTLFFFFFLLTPCRSPRAMCSE